jgi:hypothetical protein
VTEPNPPHPPHNAPAISPSSDSSSPSMSPSIAGSFCFGDECFCGEEAVELQASIKNFQEIGNNDQSIAEVVELCQFGFNLVGCDGGVGGNNGLVTTESSASAMKGTGVALGITCALCVLNAIGGGGKPWRRDAREMKA